MSIESETFKRKTVDFPSLLSYGFIKKENLYTYSTIIENDFKVIIQIDQKGTVKGKIIDLNFEEEYTNFRIENSPSSFVNKIREEYQSILDDIAASCFKDKYFIFDQSNRIHQAIFDLYGVAVEFLFDKYISYGVFKNKNKWFGIIMNIEGDKIGLSKDEIEIINVKIDESRLDSLLEINGIYPAYHMNKKSWVSILLNDSLSDCEIMKLIEISYSFTEKQACHEWIVPANPKYYDIVYAFENNQVFWKPIKNIHNNDIVYFYVAKPYSSILYQCKVIDENKNGHMELELIKTFPKEALTLTFLNTFNIKTVRGPRYMPKELIEYIEKKRF